MASGTERVPGPERFGEGGEFGSVSSPEQIDSALEHLRADEVALLLDANVLLNYSHAGACQVMDGGAYAWPLKEAVIPSAALVDALRTVYERALARSSSPPPSALTTHGIFDEVWSIAAFQGLADYVRDERVIRWWYARRAAEGFAPDAFGSDTTAIPPIFAYALNEARLDQLHRVQWSPWFGLEDEEFDHAKFGAARRVYWEVVDELRCEGTLSEKLRRKTEGKDHTKNPSDADLGLMMCARDRCVRFGSCDVDVVDAALNGKLRARGYAAEALSVAELKDVPDAGRVILDARRRGQVIHKSEACRTDDVVRGLITSVDRNRRCLRVALVDSGQRANLYIDGQKHLITEALDGVDPYDPRYAPGNKMIVVAVVGEEPSKKPGQKPVLIVRLAVSGDVSGLPA